MKHKKLIYNSTGWMLLLVSFFCISCSKNVEQVLPDNIEDASFNFYLSSEVMQQAYSLSKGTVAAYVDTHQPINGNTIMSVQTNPNLTFPAITLGTFYTPEYPLMVNGEVLRYIRYRSGPHRLFFTDVTNTTVLDTEITAAPKSKNCFYFIDKPANNGADAQYTLLKVEESQSVTEGKTGVRFVHLSPDAGKITCKMEQSNGSETEVASLDFSTVSPYQILDNSQTVAGLFRFKFTTSDGYVFTGGAPNNPGRNYVIMISGFRTAQQRRIAMEKMDNGSIRYENLTIKPGLRAEIRSTN